MKYIKPVKIKTTFKEPKIVLFVMVLDKFMREKVCLKGTN